MVFGAFKNRYEQGAFERRLRVEKEWLGKLREALLGQKSLSSFERYRTSEFVRWNLNPVLSASHEFGGSD